MGGAGGSVGLGAIIWGSVLNKKFRFLYFLNVCSWGMELAP